MASKHELLRTKSQQGKALMKSAIVDLLDSYARNDEWVKRSLVEEELDLASEYVTESGKSYKGALASMLLNELVKEKKLVRDRDGGANIYHSVKTQADRSKG